MSMTSAINKFEVLTDNEGKEYYGLTLNVYKSKEKNCLYICLSKEEHTRFKTLPKDAIKLCDSIAL